MLLATQEPVVAMYAVVKFICCIHVNGMVVQPFKQSLVVIPKSSNTP